MKNKKRFLGMIALALSCVMLGAGATMMVQSNTAAVAEAPETTTVVTSPFTAAVAAVHDSVVGVVNYQTYTNSYSNYFGNGFGYGYGYGYGRGNSQQDQQSQEYKYGSASGVVVAEGGYVLTNYHVVEDATRVEITSGENTYAATVVAYDEDLDLAVVLAPDLDLAPVTLGDSDTLQVGDWAICIGNPLSDVFTGTVTAGIVSALNRSINSTSYDQYGRKETITNYMIQIDAAINNGNSGGGMFSVTGELMGIPSIKYSGNYGNSADIDGIGMCIPINVAKPLIEEAVSGQGNGSYDVPESATEQASAANNGLTGKPRMGVTITSNPYSTLSAYGILPNGVYVSAVEAAGPAEKAGLQVGDLIVDCDGNVITSTSQLIELVGQKGVGDTVAIKVYRVEGLADYDGTSDLPEGEYIDLEITLAMLDEVAQ